MVNDFERLKHCQRTEVMVWELLTRLEELQRHVEGDAVKEALTVEATAILIVLSNCPLHLRKALVLARNATLEEGTRVRKKFQTVKKRAKK